MAVFRFLSALFALVAVVALAADATPYVSGYGPLDVKTLAEHWQTLSPKSYEASRLAVEGSAGGWVWDALATLLATPTAVAFAALAIAAGYLGRRRRRINIFVN